MAATTTRKPRRSAEDRKAEAERLHATIAEKVEQLRDSDEWTRFLDFMRSFHRYSFNNLVLILSACPEATAVAGFRQWQAKGRQVRKGEKSIRIMGYREKRLPAEATDETAGPDATDAGEQVVRYFPVLSVFDISQTDPIDPDDDPSEIVHPLTGTDDRGIVAAVTAHMQAAGWTVERERLTDRNGYTDPKAHRIAIADHLAPEHAAKTMLHEAAHVVLGHIDDLAEYVEHRGVMEAEAESTAYVLAGLAGIDTSAYSIGYVAGWIEADVDQVRETATRVLKAVHQLAPVILPDEEADAA